MKNMSACAIAVLIVLSMSVPVLAAPACCDPNAKQGPAASPSFLPLQQYGERPSAAPVSPRAAAARPVASAAPTRTAADQKGLSCCPVPSASGGVQAKPAPLPPEWVPAAGCCGRGCCGGSAGAGLTGYPGMMPAPQQIGSRARTERAVSPSAARPVAQPVNAAPAVQRFGQAGYFGAVSSPMSPLY